MMEHAPSVVVRVHMPVPGESLAVAALTDPTPDAAAEAVEWLLRAATRDVAGAYGAPCAWTLGVGTASGLRGGTPRLCVLHACFGDRALVFHASSDPRVLAQPAVARLLASPDLVVAGAALAADALALAALSAALPARVRVHSGLDLEDRLGALRHTVGRGGIRDPLAAVLTARARCAAEASALDFAVSELEPQHVTAAAMDAWVSARTGAATVERLDTAPGMLPSLAALRPRLFSLRDAPSAVVSQLAALLGSAAVLRLADITAHEVTLEAVDVLREGGAHGGGRGGGGAPTVLHLRMRDYDRRLRSGAPVTIVVEANGGDLRRASGATRGGRRPSYVAGASGRRSSLGGAASGVGLSGTFGVSAAPVSAALVCGGGLPPF